MTRVLVGLALIVAVGTVVVHRNNEVTAVQLAAWMHAGRPGLRIIDLRSDSEYAAGHVPGAQHMSLSQLRHAEFRRDETVVLYTTDGGHVPGIARVYWLRGGADAWADRHPWRGGC